jgi:hypothetical protein
VKHVRAIIAEYKLNVSVAIQSWELKSACGTAKIVIEPIDKKTAIQINLWRGHYFLHETTPFVNSDFGKTPATMKLTSIRLMYYLFELDLVRLLKVSEMPKEIEQQQFDTLNYNPEFCLKKTQLRPQEVSFDDLKTTPERIPAFGFGQFKSTVLDGH